MAISSKKTLGGIVFDTENETVWFYKSCQKSFGKMNIDVFSNLFQDEKY